MHSDEEQLSLVDSEKHPEHLPMRCSFSAILFALLFGSAALNAILLLNSHTDQHSSERCRSSLYAGLARNMPVTIFDGSDFENTNRAIQNAAWSAPELETGRGVVALSESQTKAWNLPSAQTWPWDAKKGIYVLMATHEIHCLHVLRQHVNDNHDDIPKNEQLWPYDHLLHCLNLLRESVMCNADDTPLYTGHVHMNVNRTYPKAGLGSMRMCRDWNALMAWARDSSACYKPVHWFNKSFPEADRYKFCPDSSKPWLKEIANLL